MGINTLPLNDLLGSTDPAEFSGRRALSDVSRAVAKCRRAVVITGAGISCSSGIPDFRSSDGLYSLVKARYPEAFVTGKDLFSSGLFSNPSTTSLFYTFIAELALQCVKAEPTPTHHFIAKLEQKGKMLRSYTQNIDGLERRLGLESGGRGNGYKKKATRNVEMHGDLGRVRCVLCMKDYEACLEWMEMFREGEAPDCPACQERCSARLERSARAIPVGTLRPAIVLYDEPHPLGEEIGSLQAYDLSRSPDLLLIMGTSLKVHGLKKVVKAFSRAVHARNGLVVFVNATPPAKEWEGVIDVHVQGETDVWVERVEEEWRSIRPQDWQTQTKLDGEVVVIGQGAKGKTKTKAKAKSQDTNRQEKAAEPVQLPTPRNSQSPIKSNSNSSSATKSSGTVPSTVDASPTPLSPSKRRANMPPSPVSEAGDGSASPKKKKTMSSFVPPSTGLPGTPGKGNLFSPVKPNVERGNVEETVQPAGDDEVFGSPVKVTAKKQTKKRTTKGATATSGAKAVTVEGKGKENMKPKVANQTRSRSRGGALVK